MNAVSENSGCLWTEGLSRHFGGLQALNRVSFNVIEKTITSIVGPNGAGKTTLFNLISGLDRPTEGRIFCFGQDITEWSPHRIALEMHIGRTFQNIRTFHNLTSFENVMIGRHVHCRSGLVSSVLKLPHVRMEERENRERVLELLNFVKLSHRRDELARNLTCGEQRRLELARALAISPRILLLDEPAAGLNDTELAELIQLLKQLKGGGITLLLIEHQMRLVMDISDRVLVLDFGSIIAEGIPKDIQNDARVITAYLGRR